MFSTRLFIVRYSQLFSTVLMSYRIFIKLFNLNIYFPRCSFLQQLFGIPLFIEHESVFSDCDHHDGLGMKWSGSEPESGERRAERNLINLFQPISLSAQIRPSPDRDNTSLVNSQHHLPANILIHFLAWMQNLIFIFPSSLFSRLNFPTSLFCKYMHVSKGISYSKYIFYAFQNSGLQNF